MIEIIYQGEEEKNVQDSELKLPKNVRQIGDLEFETRKIYVEDFAMTYVKHFSSRHLKYGVLLGNLKRSNGNTYLFITGAVCARPILDNEIIFDEDVWTGLYEDIKMYFEDVEIVGWFISMPGMLVNDMTVIQKLHLDNFAGNDKVCFILDRVECEDAFYLYEDGGMRKCNGHYIYYAKNADMQSYMMMNEETNEIPADYEQSNKRAINAKVHRLLYNINKENKTPVTGEFNEEGLFYNRKKGRSERKELTDHKKRKKLADAVLSEEAVLGKEQEEKTGDRKTQEKEQRETENKRKLPVFAFSVPSMILLLFLAGAVIAMKTAGQFDRLKGSVTEMVNVEVKQKKEDNLSSMAEKESKKSSKIVEVEAGVTTKTEEEQITGTNQGEQADQMSASEKGETENQTTEQAQEEQSTQEAESENNRSESKSTDSENNHQGSPTIEAESAIVTPAGQNQSDLTYYTVKKGDTLYSISLKIYGNVEKIQEIREANHMEQDEENIVIGQRLVLP